MAYDYSQLLPPDATDEEKQKLAGMFPTGPASPAPQPSGILQNPNLMASNGPPPGPPQAGAGIPDAAWNAVAGGIGPMPGGMPQQPGMPQVGGPPPPSPASLRQPMGGNTPQAWGKVMRDEANETKEQRKKNLAGAQFATQPGAQQAAQGVRPTVIPGHRQEEAWSVQQGIPVSDETKAAYSKALDLKEQAAMQAYDAGQKQAAAHAGYMDQLAQRQKALEDVQAQAEQRRQEQYQDMLSKRDQAVQDFANAGQEDKSLGKYAGSFLATIGESLGAMGAAFTGGPNMVTPMVNRAADQVIQKQKAELQKAQGRVDMSNNLLGQMREKFGDDRLAETAAKQALLARAQTEMEALTQNNAQGALQTQYMNQIGDIQKERAMLGEGFEKQAADHVQRSDRWIPTQVIGPAQPKVNWATQHQISEDAQKIDQPEVSANMKEIDEILEHNKGEVPGSGFWGRLVKSVAGEHSSFRSHDARQFDDAITSLAEARAKARGKVNDESVAREKSIIMGNGSERDVRAGMRATRRMLNATQANMNAGYDPDQVRFHQMLQQAQTPREANIRRATENPDEEDEE
jgi:hypothetical protein